VTLESMNEELTLDVEALVEEIARYLAAVQAFRTEGCEPTWRPEVAAIGIASSGRPAHEFETSAR
jgi:hypothetical protein